MTGSAHSSPDSGASAALLVRVSGWYLAFGAIMVGAGVLLASLGGWWYLSMLSGQLLTPRLITAVLLAQLLVLPGAWLLMRLLWRRSRELLGLHRGQRLATRVMALLLRTGGECWALLFLFSSLAAGLLIALAGDRLVLLSPALSEALAGLSPVVQAGGMLLAGIAVAAAGASLAALALLLSGFFAEGLLLMLQLVDDTHRIRSFVDAAPEAPNGADPDPTPIIASRH